MLKWIQVLVFLILLIGAAYISYNLWEGRIITTFSIFITISAILIGFLIFIENRDPSQTINWILVFALFPVLGFFFYLLFGRNYKKKKRFEKKQEADEEAFMKIEGERQIEERELNQMGDHQKMLFRLAHRLGNSPISFHTESKVLTNGDETFPAILDALKKAEHHIHLEYYIVRDDELGQEFKDILIEKAKAGVEVRFLYDAVGSWNLSSKYKADLIDAGVQLQAFAPVRVPLVGNRINFRNHRKIVVIDGKYGFVGGLNIGDEYLGRNENFGDWRDTHLYLRGEAVRSLQIIFLQDWNYETGDFLLKQQYLSPEMVSEEHLGGVQLIASGPDNEWETIKKLYFSMIISAKKTIWIASPYFIPDDDILTAMKVASMSGVDVRLLVPKNPDKRIVFHASRSYFPELMDAGIRVFEYPKGFMHSKVVVVDHELASIGTSNMDMRSFHLNFEVNAFLFRSDSTNQLVEDFNRDFSVAEEIDPATFKERSIFIRMIESLFRLLSPIL
ncbi:cardiolipin synthase [Halalkalibacillus sediminis]|uniref:Cardiolipin synthase n=1 Tax=Halalkalibacillus sediminis TaxID=2018042 RepID=A0A2I0QVN4_9BACI|nr:cardiolipin synthase [Halalkalibacillus sediminis]PKR78349.1 cardiolipin synthase [Halalkalibacillus sediminis]